MPSYAELESEPAWLAEVTPAALEWLGAQLRAHYHKTRSEIGSKGDNRHLNGGHRSRRWIKQSVFCTNRTYTVTHANDKLGDEDWHAALDVGLSHDELVAMCKRLDVAVRAGLFEEISEWYGNLGGDLRVDGWDNIADRLASSSSSHLTHLHITFFRRFTNDMALMRRLLAVLIGDDMPTAAEIATAVWTYNAGSRTNPVTAIARLNQVAAGSTTDLVARLDAILAAARDDGDVSVVLGPEALAAVQEVRDAVAAVPTATAELVHADLAD